MRKLVLAATTIVALAVPTIVPALASADVARYQKQTATFTVTQPRLVNHQFNTVYTHDIKVTVNPCDNTFTGTGTITGAQGEVIPAEDVTGTFGDGTVSLSMTRPGQSYSVDLVNGKTDGTTISHPTTSSDNGYVDVIDFTVTKPVFTNTSTFKNHGEYVSSQGGGSDAAHSCIGMPIH